MKHATYIILLIAAIGLTWYLTDQSQPDYTNRIKELNKKIDSLSTELNYAKSHTDTLIIYRDSIRNITDTLIVNRPIYEAPIIDTLAIDSILRSIYARHGVAIEPHQTSND